MTSLFVDRRNVQLELDAGAIVFRENGERIGTVPIAPLTRVFLRGDVHLSSSLLGRLGEKGIGVVILSGRQGKPSLLLARPHNDASRRVEQIRKSLDADFCLHFSRALIDTKLQRQIEWFDELRATDAQARYALTHAMHALTAHRNHLRKADTLASLRGIEGSAAHCYFEGLKATVPAQLNFKKRNRRPPRDPFNALLSLTYTLVHAELAIALYGAGLDPYVGFYHQLDFGRESLASDLLEPLRPLVDRFCLHLVQSRTLTADHFSTSDAGCLLGKAGRTHYYAAYEKYSEVLRTAIQAHVSDTVRCIGTAIAAPALDPNEDPEE
jgi:CRISPR-associated protein Cas1